MTLAQVKHAIRQDGISNMGLILYVTVTSILYLGMGLALMADIAKMFRENHRSELFIRSLSPFIILGWPVYCLLIGVFIICDGIFDFIKNAITTIYKG